MTVVPDQTSPSLLEAWTTPLEAIDPANPDRFRDDTIAQVFARLRREDPVHYTPESRYGPYWSITKYRDIVAVELDHEQFSSEAALGGVTVSGSGGSRALPMFIAMDPPEHTVQRRTVAPALSPTGLKQLEPLIRERAGTILDALPIGEEFDWVERVSVELTTMTLATLFGFSQERRRDLGLWSDVVSNLIVYGGIGDVPERSEWKVELQRCFETFTQLWEERRTSHCQRGDLISMLAHGPDTRNMDLRALQGNVVLLIVGGNDTSRNTITGSVLALNDHPAEYDKLRADASLIPSMVAETLRWQTPLAHMRRTALRDVDFRGKRIRRGDKVVLWYVSGNRDEEVIGDADSFIVNRARSRNHISFGCGIHRCVGSRLAELQLQIVWEEILKRFSAVEVTRPPERTFSSFVRGYDALHVRIPSVV